MIYVITNVDLKYNFTPDNISFIFFNPWGFSKSSIKNNFLKAIEGLSINKEDKIVLIMKPLFFGNRIKIVERTLLDNFQNVKSLNCLKSPQFISLDEIA